MKVCGESVKKILVFLIIVMTIGCSSNKEMGKDEIMEVKPSKLPKVEAFQDEYTRKYMYSTKEVEEGYYLFESDTKKYTMNFPENGVVRDQIRSKDNRSESVNFVFHYSDNSLSEYNYRLVFFLKPLEDEEKAIDKMQVYPDVDFDYNKDMRKVETEDRIIYHNLIRRDLDNGGIELHLMGVIESKRIPQVIAFNAKLGIFSEEDLFSGPILDKASNEILELVKTVEFRNQTE